MGFLVKAGDGLHCSRIASPSLANVRGGQLVAYPPKGVRQFPGRSQSDPPRQGSHRRRHHDAANQRSNG